MAGETAHSIGMDTPMHTPIAQLSPVLDALATRSIRAVVTLKWPYSSATGIIAFLLSEPDFRLRKSRGQVRVQFAGSSAKNVAKAGIASGDEISLCLDGAGWLQSQDNIGTPGRCVDFELKFTEKLHLQFKPADSSEFTTIDIDHPAPNFETTPVFARIPTPEPSPSLPTTNGTYVKPASFSEAVNEWSSPAFLKRARTSYGSLFEADYDPFSEDDGSIQGKGRKRTRLSAVWRYASRSPTPEPVEEAMQEDIPESTPKAAPTMMDEACQTDVLETGVAAEALADFARQSTNIGTASYPQLISEPHPTEDILPNGTGDLAEDVIMPPPDIRILTPEVETQIPELNSDPAPEFIGQTPSSPRLHPIPSDSLPLVSPLIHHNYGFSFGRPLGAASDTITEDQAAVPDPNPTRNMYREEEEEDLYGASPIRRHRNLDTHEFNGFQEPAGGGQSASFPKIGEPVAMEHQYGQWQSANLSYSLTASPFKDNDQDYEQPQIGHSYDEEQNQFENSVPPSHGQISQYPQIDPELMRTVQYPELHQGSEVDEGLHEDEAEHAIAAPPQAAPAMSRSQSAQSPIVDLTEDSDEDEDGNSHEKEQASVKRSESEGDSEEEEAEALRRYGVQDEVQIGRHIQRGSEASDNDYIANSDVDAEGEELLVDEYGNVISDDEEEDGVPADARYSRIHGEDEEGSLDEEESYDEDEGGDESEGQNEEEQAPRGDLIFIDLVSSDEEEKEAGEPSVHAANIPQRSQSQSQPSLAGSAEESESNDEEKSDEDENKIPYNEREEVRTRLPRDSPPMQTYEVDDAMYEADGDGEELADAGNDSLHEEELPGLPSTQEAVSLSSGSEDDAEEDGENKASASDEEDERVQDSHDVAIENDESRHIDDEEQVMAAKNDVLGQHERTESAENEERLSEMGTVSNNFALDGASDEHMPTTVAYPDLPNEPSPPASFDEDTQPSGRLGSSAQAFNAQLPTPETSQLVEKIVTTESSFTSTVVESAVERTTIIESHTIRQIESSNEIQVTEVTTEVSSIHLQSSHSDEEQQTDITQQDVDRDEPFVIDDVLMSEASEGPEDVDNAMAQESIEASLVEDDDQIKQSDHMESGEIERLSEVKSDVDAQLQGNISEREDTPMEDADEADDADEDATAVESDEDEGSETLRLHSLKQGVITRSVVQALAEAEAGDDDSPVQDEPNSQLIEEQTKHIEGVAEEPEFTPEHPRRSHRRVKSTASVVNDEDHLRPVTPVKSHPVQKHEQHASEPRDPRNNPISDIGPNYSTPRGHDASFELALSSLESPSKPSHDLRNTPIVDLKLRLSRALRTELGEFTALKVLRYHMNQKLDVLAIATTTPPEPQRAKGGPRHYQITFNITDPSIAPSGVTEVQVFRPYSHALPTISAGDGILLRNFQVTSVQKGFALRSLQEEGSSWAVFKDDDEPEIRGPPVEFGDAEKNHVHALKTWFAGLDDEGKAKIRRANEGKAAARR